MSSTSDLRAQWQSTDSFRIGTQALCVFSTLIVLLRLYTRIFIAHFFGADDALIIIASVASIAGCIVVWETLAFGLGQHIIHVPPEYFLPFGKLVFAEVLLYPVAAHSIRASLVLFYLRLSVSQQFHRICWIYIVFNATVYLTYTIVGVFECHPVAFFWDHSIPGGTCMDQKMLYISNGVLLVFMDVAVLSLPLPALWRLNLNLRQKLTLASLLALGAFTCVSTCYRLPQLFSFSKDADVTYSTLYSHMWSLIEVNCGLLAASFPMIKPLLTRYVPRAFGSSIGSSKHDFEMSDSNTNRQRSNIDRVSRIPIGSCEELLEDGITVPVPAKVPARAN